MPGPGDDGADREPAPRPQSVWRTARGSMSRRARSPSGSRSAGTARPRSGCGLPPMTAAGRAATFPRARLSPKYLRWGAAEVPAVVWLRVRRDLWLSGRGFVASGDADGPLALGAVAFPTLVSIAPPGSARSGPNDPRRSVASFRLGARIHGGLVEGRRPPAAPWLSGPPRTSGAPQGSAGPRWRGRCGRLRDGDRWSHLAARCPTLRGSCRARKLPVGNVHKASRRRRSALAAEPGALFAWRTRRTPGIRSTGIPVDPTNCLSSSRSTNSSTRRSTGTWRNRGSGSSVVSPTRPHTIQPAVRITPGSRSSDQWSTRRKVIPTEGRAHRGTKCGARPPDFAGSRRAVPERHFRPLGSDLVSAGQATSEPGRRFELLTCSLRVSCSTD